jgi:ubiquinone/menaquinone biosynthesis C-methylase UbiE
MKNRDIFWNLKARFYSQARCLPILGDILNSEIRNLQSLMNRIPGQTSIVLDIGTGAGSTLTIMQNSTKCIGMDRSLNMIREAKKKYSILAVNGDACFLPFQDNTFHIISAIGLTEYLSHIECFVQGIARVITGKGHFLVTISQPNFFNFLRNILGNRIYPLRQDAWETAVRKAGFTLIACTKSLMQIQYLLKYSE